MIPGAGRPKTGLRRIGRRNNRNQIYQLTVPIADRIDFSRQSHPTMEILLMRLVLAKAVKIAGGLNVGEFTC